MLIKRSLVLVPILAAALFLAPAPQAAQAHSAADVGNVIIDYVPNLINDVLDAVKVRITVGNGYSVDARATHLLDIGASEYEGTGYGLSGRELGPAEVAGSDKGLTLLGMSYGENSHDGYEVGATVHCFAGIDASANLRSVLDIFTGLILIDIEGDNTSLEILGD